MTYVVLFLSIVLNVVAIVLLVRAARRLLQFDDIWQAIIPELEDYSIDLKGMSSGDILIDHPEIEMFHKRNVRALQSLESILDSVKSVRPKREKPPVLPRPVWED